MNLIDTARTILTSQPKVFEGYSKELERVLTIAATDRGVSEYAFHLGFTDSDELMRYLPTNANILDIGSGEEIFKKELSICRPDLNVVSINPALADTELRNKYNTPNTTIAINPELPIENECFHVIFDQMASVYYNDEKEVVLLRRKLNEIIRLLKPDGYAFIGPTFIFPDADYEGNGAVGSVLNTVRGIFWDKREFEPYKASKYKWRAYHIHKQF